MSRATTTCCAHGWWWVIAYTARIVFWAFYGDAEYIQRTDLCHARITAIRLVARHARATTPNTGDNSLMLRSFLQIPFFLPQYNPT